MAAVVVMIVMVLLDSSGLTTAVAAGGLETQTVHVAPEVLTDLVKLAESFCVAMPHLSECQQVKGTFQTVFEEAGLDTYHPGNSFHYTAILDQHALIYQQYSEAMQTKENLTSAVVILRDQKEEKIESVSRLESRITNFRNVTSSSSRSSSSPSSPGTGALNPWHGTSQYSPTAFVHRPTDCADLLLMGHSTSGVYDIYPFRCKCSKPVKVWCDMETEGGGWTTFVSRQVQDKRENFSRTWDDFQAGFGNSSAEYYLGNEILHTLTSSRGYILRADFHTKEGYYKWAKWSKFIVNNPTTKYKLDVGGFQTISLTDDCMAQFNGRPFSTWDFDNDPSSSNHALTYHGGWWYNNPGLLLPFNLQSDGTIASKCRYIFDGAWVIMNLNKLQLKMRPTVCNNNVKAAYFNTHNCNMSDN
ncbi:techylectin-5A-like [Homarus americanus]|uniref:techylectin-5A-like n=1 Tax=Homarus americanus TaxID=6706 RepID=UPI001C491D5B|nr:techylectin-5A-like [Homarus americanus]